MTRRKWVDLNTESWTAVATMHSNYNPLPVAQVKMQNSPLKLKLVCLCYAGYVLISTSAVIWSGNTFCNFSGYSLMPPPPPPPTPIHYYCSTYKIDAKSFTEYTSVTECYCTSSYSLFWS